MVLPMFWQVERPIVWLWLMVLPILEEIWQMVLPLVKVWRIVMPLRKMWRTSELMESCHHRHQRLWKNLNNFLGESTV